MVLYACQLKVLLSKMNTRVLQTRQHIWRHLYRPDDPEVAKYVTYFREQRIIAREAKLAPALCC